MHLTNNYFSFAHVIVYNYIYDDDCDLDIQNVSD